MLVHVVKRIADVRYSSLQYVARARRVFLPEDIFVSESGKQEDVITGERWVHMDYGAGASSVWGDRGNGADFWAKSKRMRIAFENSPNILFCKLRVASPVNTGSDTSFEGWSESRIFPRHMEGNHVASGIARLKSVHGIIKNDINSNPCAL